MSMTKTVMVVEDDEALNEAYGIILESAGHTVLRATDGGQALDLLSEGKHQPDIIFLDLRMPNVDGITFLERYDAKKFPHTKVIVFSNFDEHTTIDKAYSLGADRYVLKARATPAELLKIVETS